MSLPIVSILMPMLNARRFVREAIESLLDQAGVPLEVVVVDDGSTDGSVGEVRAIDDARVRLMSGDQGVRGVARAFNTALFAARGELLARCDADDRYTQGRLARQINWLQENPDFGAVCGGLATITERGRFVRELSCGNEACEITGELLCGETRTSLCTWLLRTETVRRVNGCREFFKTGEDIDLQLRLAEQCRVWFDPRQAYLYRLHDSSATHSSSRAMREFYESTARLCLQQRRLGQLDDLQRERPPIAPDDDGAPIDSSRDQIQGMLLGAAWDEHAAGRRANALRTALRACLTKPSRFSAWKSFGALAIRGQRS